MYTPSERFIGITGGSCSGKTLLCNNLATRLGDKLTLFSFDDMFVGMAAVANKGITDWENPDLYRWDDFLSHLRELKAGHSVTILANESRERRTPETLHIQVRPIVVVVGFLALHNPEVRKLFDTTVYLDVPETEIIRRRLARAVPNDPWDSVEYVTGELIAGHRRVVVPQRKLADYVLDATLPPDQVADDITAIIQA
jgi:uridine kinase